MTATSTPVADTPETRISARHILVSWRGAEGAAPYLRRSRAEARARAEEALARIRGGADFAEVAKAYSDDITATRGGFLGIFERGTKVEPFERAAFALKPGEVSGVVETPFGYHLILRLPLEEIHVGQILVQWQGAPKATVTRTREEANARIAEAQARLEAGEDFGQVAHALSDGPAAPWGGDIGWVQRGQLAPRIEETVYALGPGQRSAIVETALGFHIFTRLDETATAPPR